MGIGLSILLAFVLILVNGYFSMSEMALVNASKPLLDHEAEEGDKSAKRAANLASDSGNFLATIQVAITLVGFFSSAVASTNLSDPFAQWMSSFGIGWLTAVAPVLSPILITLAVSYFSIVLGELVPKRIALADTEKVAKMVSGPLIVFGKIASPLVWLTSASANLVASVFRIKQADEGQVSEEEIKYMVAEQEDLSDDEKRMIHEVFDLGDAVVRQVMVPRVDVTAVEDVQSAREVLSLMQKTGYSRMPVYHDDMDEVIGIVKIKDLIAPALAGKGDNAVSEFVRPCLFVPETKDLLPLLTQMRAEREQMAIVIDEYGGTAGLITIEDIVEEVVGEIRDEYDQDEQAAALSACGLTASSRTPCLPRPSRRSWASLWASLRRTCCSLRSSGRFRQAPPCFLRPVNIPRMRGEPSRATMRKRGPNLWLRPPGAPGGRSCANATIERSSISCYAAWCIRASTIWS